ncbi:MAG: hypothetical protein AAF468_22340 [Pseudomonadota bacterium]
MKKTDQSPDKQVPMRPAEQVMKLARMGSFHHSRLSFMRVLLRRLRRENWRFDRPLWRIDDKGVGVATYRAIGPARTYTLVAFSHDLPDELRSDRVIAEAWDATFTLFDGEPTEDDLERLSSNVPLQEAGRVSESELSLSRANRSVRLFNHVVEALSRGEQPDQSMIDGVGYLMRTTAVYGSGKFGAADRSKWADREEFAGSFQPELLSVWLIRSFSIDIVEHLARVAGAKKAAKFAPELKRRLGIGNSTGLGMAPFLINHPTLVDAWIGARETALQRVRSIAVATPARWEMFLDRLYRARLNAETWQVDHPHQMSKILILRKDFDALINRVEQGLDLDDHPFDQLYCWSEAQLSLEGQEQLVSLVLEPYGDLVDDLSATMSSSEADQFSIDGRQTVAQAIDLMEENYEWALRSNFVDSAAIARVWYVSEEKLEPRLGERFEEPIEPYEQPLAPGRDIKSAYEALKKAEQDQLLAAFLLRHPEHRGAVRRAQMAANHRYAEICDNTIAADMMPIDLLRCKLSFFGATRFDPRSDRWVRITMYQHAPFPNEINEIDPDDVVYPPIAQGVQ